MDGSERMDGLDELQRALDRAGRRRREAVLEEARGLEAPELDTRIERSLAELARPAATPRRRGMWLLAAAAAAAVLALLAGLRLLADSEARTPADYYVGGGELSLVRPIGEVPGYAPFEWKGAAEGSTARGDRVGRRWSRPGRSGRVDGDDMEARWNRRAGGIRSRAHPLAAAPQGRRWIRRGLAHRRSLAVLALSALALTGVAQEGAGESWKARVEQHRQSLRSAAWQRGVDGLLDIVDQLDPIVAGARWQGPTSAALGEQADAYWLAAYTLALLPEPYRPQAVDPVAYLEKAAHGARFGGDDEFQGNIAWMRAMALRRERRSGEARAVVEQALDELGEMVGMRPLLLVVLAQLEREAGALDEALARVEESQRALDGIAPSWSLYATVETYLLGVRAEVYAAIGLIDQAFPLVARERELALASGQAELVAASFLHEAELYLASARPAALGRLVDEPSSRRKRSIKLQM